MNSENNSTIVVIDDEEVIRFNLQKKLSRAGYNVISLEKAEDALYLIKKGSVKIDLIISDIKLRKMDGIELLSRINGIENPIPVLIITGHGNVEDAIKALRFGVSDFIRKPFDINDLVSSVRSILKDKKEKYEEKNLSKYAVYEEALYSLPSDPALVNPLSYKLTQDLVPAGICNNLTAENISLALREALNNAVYHGNFEISSSLREEGGIKKFNNEYNLKKENKKFSGRLVKIKYRLSAESAVYRIEDEGAGFDFRSLPDPRNPENFFKHSGRGLLIIAIHMDRVEWEGRGNIITMTKNKVERNS